MGRQTPPPPEEMQALSSRDPVDKPTGRGLHPPRRRGVCIAYQDSGGGERNTPTGLRKRSVPQEVRGLLPTSNKPQTALHKSLPL